MYKATVIEIFVASPSDVFQERKCCREIIEDWNVVNSKKRKAVLKSVGWEQNLYSSLEGQEPQAIINNQILKNSDLLVGIFWTRLGTPTLEYESGTVEEIKKHMQQRKPVMLFFSDVPVVLSSVDTNQYEKLQEFKTWCKSKGIIDTFNSVDEFNKKFRNQLGIIMNDSQYILNLIGKDEYFELVSENHIKSNIGISENGKQLLKEISLDVGGQLTVLKTVGGYSVYTHGNSFGSDTNDPREIAAINAAIEELERYDLIKATNFDRELFNITAKGYEIADKLL